MLAALKELKTDIAKETGPRIAKTIHRACWTRPRECSVWVCDIEMESSLKDSRLSGFELKCTSDEDY